MAFIRRQRRWVATGRRRFRSFGRRRALNRRLNRRLNQLGRPKAELKRYAISYNAVALTSISTGADLGDPLGGIAIGTGPNNRIGNKIYVEKIRMWYRFYRTSSVVDPDANEIQLWHRCIGIHVKNQFTPSATAPPIDIDPATIGSIFRSYTPLHQSAITYKVIFDRKYFWTPYNTGCFSVAGANDFRTHAYKDKLLFKDIPWKKVVVYSPTGDVMLNDFVVYTWVDDQYSPGVASEPVFVLSAFEVWFRDA